jgi:hypothetical protein
LRTLRPTWRAGIAALAFAGVFAVGLYATLRIVPIASSGPLRDFALKNNNDLREEIGWDELVAQVAAIRDALPADQQGHLGIAVGNYGEYGAVACWGRATICPHRSPRSTPAGCAATRKRHPPRSSCWEIRWNASTSFSPIAEWLATPPIGGAYAMKKA